MVAVLSLSSRAVRGLAALGLLVPLLGTQATASVDADLPPVAVSGTVAGDSRLSPGDLLVTIEPDQAWVDAQVGTSTDASVYPSFVPAGLITTEGDTFAVHLDPRALPAQDISQLGLVTLDVSARDAAGDDYGATVESVRARLLPDGTYAWADPLAPTTRAPRPVVATIAHLSGSGHLGPYIRSEARANDEQSGAGDRIDEPTVVVDDPAHEASSCVAGPDGNGAGVVRGQKRRVMVAIGTSFPVGTDQAKMAFESGGKATFTAEMGVGVEDGNGPILEQSSSKGMDTGFGFSWDMAGYQRAYLVQQTYQHITDWGDRCPGNPIGPYFQTWEPISYTGGVGQAKDIGTPYYTHCVRIGVTGVWTKDNAKSSAYHNDNGVHIADWIGINLDSERSYNTAAALFYKMTTARHWLCGNNAAPRWAAKVQDSTYSHGS